MNNMPQINDVEKLYNLVLFNLYAKSPKYSGNMASSIKTSEASGTEFTIVIDAPYYDVNEYKKRKVIIHDGGAKNGTSSYATSVNEKGGFGTHNQSMHWVNRACIECVRQIAAELGAIVINELEL